MKKIIALILAAMMLTCASVLFTSCGEKADTLDMATNAAFPPYEFKDTWPVTPAWCLPGSGPVRTGLQQVVS